MTKNHKVVLTFTSLVVFVGLGFLITKAIRDNQYETAQLYNTAVQATETDRFNYAVDSRQGNVLTRGTFSAVEPVSMPEDVRGEYFRITKYEERYTRHTETYQCGTEENPRTCIRTYYTWDGHGSDVLQTPTLRFHERIYPTSLFSFSGSRAVGCGDFMKSCNGGYHYDDDSWWASEGDLRWSYRVRDLAFDGTILVNTLDGTLRPLSGQTIDIKNEDIATILKQVNSTTGASVFFVCWMVIVIGAHIGFLKSEVIDGYSI